MQTGGKIIYAMDALFGLPRKKAASVSYRPAVQGHLFFLSNLVWTNMLQELRHKK